MVILDIKQPGFFLQLPGIPPFRTPARVDISKLNVNLVIAELTNHGIEEYVITKEPPKSKQLEEKKSRQKDESLDRRLGKIEGMLKELLTKETPVVKVASENSGDVDRIFDEPEKEFIPEINMSNMKLEGQLSTSVEESDTGQAEDAANLLHELKGDKK